MPARGWGGHAVRKGPKHNPPPTTRARLSGGDYVVVARPAAARATGAQIEQSFLKLLRKAGALPPPVRGGTMPAASPSDSMPDLPSG